ncbi:MAG: carbohydrate ABC transporter permease [Acetatifactor sp.]|jgi:putative aldouronate transport system permease protein|nr:carbohydrate ABC transporter permease [Acetatifactor sp.]
MKKSLNDRVFDAVIIVISVLILLMVAYPLYFVIIASFSKPEAVLAGKLTFLPVGFNLKSYQMVLQEAKIWRGYRNTILYTVLGTVINLFVTTLCAYPLSRKDMPCRTFLTFVASFTMLFGGGMIPVYLVVKNIGITDSIWAMVIPNALNTYNMLVMKNYFQSSIPGELQEAAAIDGCSHVQTLLKVVLPLSKSILAVITLFYAVQHWNAFFNAIIYLRDESLYPLQIILREILLQNSLEAVGGDLTGMYEKVMQGETMKYALIIVASVPILIFYPFVQKHFTKGIMVGAVKG